MSLRGNIGANFAGQFWMAAMGLAFLPLYIRVLGTESYGLVGTYALLQAWLSLLELGMSPLLNREMARFTAGAVGIQHIRNLLRSCEWIAVGVAIFIGGLVWSSAGWLSSHLLRVERLPIPVVAEAIGIMGMIVGLRICEGIYRTTLLGLQRQVLFNIVGSISATARWAGAAAVILFVTADIRDFFLWQGAVSLGTVFALRAAANVSLPPAQVGPHFDRRVFRGIWRFALGMVAISLLSVALLQIDKVLVIRLVPLSDFAHYSFAATVAGALGFLAGPISQAYYPRLTEAVAADDDALERSNYHEASQLLSWLVVPPAMMLIIFAGPILTAWTNDPPLVAAASGLVAVFAGGTMLNCLMSMPYMLQLAHGWTKLTIYVNAGATLALIAGILLAVPRYGIYGAAVAWLIVVASYGQVILWIMHRRLLREEYFTWLRRAWAVPIVTSALGCAALRGSIPITGARWLGVAQLAVYSSILFVLTGLAMPYTRRLILAAVNAQRPKPARF